MSEPRKNKAPSAQPPTVLRDERVGTAGFEFNGLHARPLFYRHLCASQRPYWQLWATMDRQTLRQTSNRRIPASPVRQRRLRTDPQDDVERQVRVLCLDSRLQLLGCRGARKLLQEVVAFSDPLRFKTTHSGSLHSSSLTRGATRAVVGADYETADGVYLKRPPPAQAPCPRANPGLHLATLQASGRVALAPRRCAVTRA